MSQIYTSVKILFLSSSDTNGGAAKAAYRLFVGLRNKGVSVKMLVRDKATNDPDVISCLDFERKGWIGKLDKFIWKIKNRIRKQKWKKYPDREPVFLNDLNSISLLRAIRSIDFDILHLHFVANRFLDLRELTKINKPIVWTLHDSWPFTGICHYFYNCTHYLKNCGTCPALHSTNKNDFTNKIWKIKNEVYNRCDLHIVTPSKWLGESASKSSLMNRLSVSIIPNCIDTASYRNFSNSKNLNILGLQKNKLYIMFGAVQATSDSRKGFILLVEALSYLKQKCDKPIELLIFGADKPEIDSKFHFPTHYFGTITKEQQLIELYNTANVTIVPSQSENLSCVIMESMSCGTPVVGFNIGGNSDMIDHKKNGYLANPFDCNDLGDGILWCIENNMENKLGISARQKVIENFTIEKVVAEYTNLYQNRL